MSKILKKLALVTAVSASLAACGGGGGSDEQSALDVLASNPDAGTDFTITAIDGYLSNAKVFADINANNLVDIGDIELGRTNQDGKLTVAAEYRLNNLIVQAIANETVDSDTGVVSSSFELAAPPSSLIISPFTHLAQLQGRSTSDIADELNLDKSVLSGDFIVASEASDDAKVAHALARFIVSQMTSPLDAGVMTDLSLVKNQVELDLANDIDPYFQDYEINSGAVTSAEGLRMRFTPELLAKLSGGQSIPLENLRADTYSLTSSFDSDTNQFCFDEIAAISASAGAYSCFDASTPGGQLWLTADNEFKTYEMLHIEETNNETSLLMISEDGDAHFLSSHTYVASNFEPTSFDATGEYHIVADDNLSTNFGNVDVLQNSMTLTDSAITYADDEFSASGTYTFENDVLDAVFNSSEFDDREVTKLSNTDALQIFLVSKPSARSIEVASRSEGLISKIATVWSSALTPPKNWGVSNAYSASDLKAGEGTTLYHVKNWDDATCESVYTLNSLFVSEFGDVDTRLCRFGAFEYNFSTLKVSDGVLKLDSELFGTTYVNRVSFDADLDAYEICFAASAEEAQSCESPAYEFKNKRAARAYMNFQNFQNP